ncbi:MAG: hypothetical protein MMC33_007435 [Icmadophila ericetorum]|nr:hypothetical protein [Icmadophila ericetorum]
MPSVATPPSETTTKSGIITTETGERHIPSSVRPDGSKRKEIKIRPGYKPPEDVEVYKNRTAETWKTRSVGGVPGAAPVETDKTTNGAGTTVANKNAKRREARKKAKATGGAAGPDEASEDEAPKSSKSTSTLTKAPSKENGTPANSESTPGPDPTAEKEKQARALKKKLRQARELRERKDSGQNLLPEQFEKVIKIGELIRQLDALGFDANGEPKEGKVVETAEPPVLD